MRRGVTKCQRQHPVISIHAPTWGATVTGISERDIMSFQSTHPRGVRLVASKHGHAFLAFQSTHPRGVRRAPSSSSPPVLFYFNPRTHVGCDDIWQRMADLGEISIHAPTWGATLTSEISIIRLKISIHAPTWGATVEDDTSREAVRISIHAPTWGATSDRSSPGRLLRNFNPRTHVGCDSQ